VEVGFEGQLTMMREESVDLNPALRGFAGMADCVLERLVVFLAAGTQRMQYAAWRVIKG